MRSVHYDTYLHRLYTISDGYYRRQHTDKGYGYKHLSHSSVGMPHLSNRLPRPLESPNDVNKISAA